MGIVVVRRVVVWGMLLEGGLRGRGEDCLIVLR